MAFGARNTASGRRIRFRDSASAADLAAFQLAFRAQLSYRLAQHVVEMATTTMASSTAASTTADSIFASRNSNPGRFQFRFSAGFAQQ